MAELSADLQRFCMIFDDVDPSEDDHASKEQPKVVSAARPAVVNTIGSFVVCPDGVDLVPGFPAVKIETPVLVAIPVIVRHPVWIPVVAKDRQHAAPLGFEKLQAFPRG